MNASFYIGISMVVLSVVLQSLITWRKMNMGGTANNL